MASLIEQSTVAAEGIKQLVEQGRKTLVATEQLTSLFSRLGPSSGVARAFEEAAIAAGNQSRYSPAARAFEAAAIQNGVSQIQAASQPKRSLAQPARLRADEWPGNMPPLPSPSATRPEIDIGLESNGRAGRKGTPPRFESIQAAMLRAIERGEDPVQAARNPGGLPLGPKQWPQGMPGLPLGPNQWPAGMPGLPVGSPGNPAPANMPPLPQAAPTAAPSGGMGLGGLLSGGVGSLLRIGALAGTGAAAIAQQFGGSFSAGHGIEQWNQESNRQAEFQTSLLTRLRVAGDMISTAADALPSVGRGLWQHFFESGKTSVGNGPK